MHSVTITLKGLKETKSLGQLLGRLAQAGDVICLDGDLGAGKTTLTQSIATGLEVPENSYVSSPSFAIMHQYEGRIPMYHMDFYRLGDVTEVEDLGFEEYFYLDGLTVIEWSERAMDILPDKKLTLNFTLNYDLTRTIMVQGSLRNTSFPRLLSDMFEL
ncbi:MAG: tRNA (adenosine(37)-N6)-threonylcarbamoyltransferase complex ATPase subunit type 1 TsaE [Proteobacteria bacterium]|nr:tRNA (adenosine(37)-N6)-threonylcarbamoyltransferase complex ATPase subunit type 1 TsaE [Desulfobulbaceae bacterium]MCP4296874.1 tRNA (adenosine(37)-N6)-threonylcarbamoyltransferase complex ATPase subunit type 1 TsaE [Pseudomonadota bacterium]